jgi:hypothetical protein
MHCIAGEKTSAARGRRLSRAGAFAAQGVRLRHPAHSWSGVRFGDGAVVLAIRASDVRMDDHGCSCLLWERRAGGFARWLDSLGEQERLEHCRLAVRNGGAQGLLVHGEGVDPLEVIALRVVKLGSAYWAKWGSVARVERSDRVAPSALRRFEACLAA